MARISKRVVDAAQPAEKDIFIWDDRIIGFGLKVATSGVKSYVYQYRNAEGRSRRATIGKHGAWATEKAREKAEVWQRMVFDGGDPLEAKRQAREAMTVGELLNEYLESAKFAEKADSTRAVDRGRIERHLRPLLGKRVVEKLGPEDIRRTFNAIRDGRTAVDVKTCKRGRAIVKGGAGTARSAIRLLRAIFSWAVDERLISANPVTGVRIGPDGQRDAVMRDADDYKRLFEWLSKAQSELRMRPEIADAIRVLALTGARRGEIAGLRWRHVRLNDALLVIDKHKTARSTGEPRVIGLPAAAQAVIAARATDDAKPDDYVFGETVARWPQALTKAWTHIRVEAGLPEGIGLHGLRHSLATIFAFQGAQAAEVMTALGHKQLSTSQRYVHAAQDAHVALAERAASMISDALRASQGAELAEVVPIEWGRK